MKPPYLTRLETFAHTGQPPEYGGSDLMREDTLTSLSALKQAYEEIHISDKLLEQRNKVLAAIPACPDHGDQCIPHAIEWVQESIAIRVNREELIEALKVSNAQAEHWKAARESAMFAGEEMKKQIKALQADAERYRCLRDKNNWNVPSDLCASNDNSEVYFGDDLDTQLDAKRKGNI